jgi:hypothetical protein
VILAMGAAMWLFLSLTGWGERPYWPDADGYTMHVAEGRWVAHPPGYMFFVVLGRLVSSFGLPAFLSVQIASFLLALASIPVMALLLRNRSAPQIHWLLVAAFAFGWILMLILRTGTSHSADLLTVALLLLAALNPALNEKKITPYALLALAIAATAGFRLNSAIMQAPMLVAILLLDWKNWRLWSAFVFAGLLIASIQITVIFLSGGWEPFFSYTSSMSAGNSEASILLAGIKPNTLLNSLRALLWFSLSAGPLLLYLRWLHPNQIIDRAFLLGLLSFGGVLFLNTFYLSTHPGLLAGALPGFFLCVARLSTLDPSPAKRIWIPIGSIALSLSLFLFLKPIEKIESPAQAIANGILLQYGRPSASASIFHITAEWLVISGFSHLVAPDRIRELVNQGRLDSKYLPSAKTPP